jgi:hypothetical protein
MVVSYVLLYGGWDVRSRSAVGFFVESAILGGLKILSGQQSIAVEPCLEIRFQGAFVFSM